MPDLRIPAVQTVRQPRHLRAVRHEHRAAGAGAEQERRDARVQMHAVGQDAVVRRARPGCGRVRQGDERGQARVGGGAVVREPGHAVEGVGEACCAGGEGGEALRVGGGGVAEGDADAAAGE